MILFYGIAKQKSYSIPLNAINSTLLGRVQGLITSAEWATNLQPWSSYRVLVLLKNLPKRNKTIVDEKKKDCGNVLLLCRKGKNQSWQERSSIIDIDCNQKQIPKLTNFNKTTKQECQSLTLSQCYWFFHICMTFCKKKLSLQEIVETDKHRFTDNFEY